MFHMRFIPPNHHGENRRRSKRAGEALHGYETGRVTPSDTRNALAAMLVDLMHWCDYEGQAFDTQLARAREVYARETSGQGTAGAGYELICKLIAERCGYTRDAASGMVKIKERMDDPEAPQWPDWETCCESNAIAVDPPDPYEIAARERGWTSIDEGGWNGNLICRRTDLDERAGPEYGSWRACCEDQRIEPATVPSLDDVARLRLVIEVDYELNGTPVRALEDNLRSIAERAKLEAMLSGSTSAEVAEAPYSVERLV